MTPMNWPVVYPEIWLLVAACAVLLVDLFNSDAQRRPTFWLTQASVAVFAWLHLDRALSGMAAYGMKGMVVVDPMGDLLAFFAALAVLITVAYARPRWARARCSRASSSRSRSSCCWASA
jgi:NADH-quinone oxidoreductase subunit N